MIYTDIKHVEQYLGMDKNLDTAIRYIKKQKLEELKDGKNVIDEERVFVNRFRYETLPETETSMESHLAYADIHLVLEGSEKIGVAPVEDLTVTGINPQEDQVDCFGDLTARLPLKQGKILILFPGEAHMVKIMDQASCHVEKAVMKVKMEGLEK